MKLRSLVASMAFMTVCCAPAFAADLPALADWKGHYTSVESVWTDSRTDRFYEEIAREAKAQGKEATAQGTKAVMARRYYAPFESCDIDETGITYTLKDGKQIRLEYEFAGTVASGKGAWTWFTASKADVTNAPFANIVMTAVHGKDAQHFHFRIGSDDGVTLMQSSLYRDWHGTCQQGEVDYETYMKDFDAKRYVKFAL